MKTKQTNSLSKFVNYKKFTFVIPIILLALALLVFAIWGVNKGVDYKNSYTYNVYFNTTVNNKEYKDYTSVIRKTIKQESNGEFTVVITKTNDDISSACKVNVINNSKLTDSKFVEKLESINASIKEQLDAKNTSRQVRISDVEFQAAENFSKSLVMGIIAVAVIAVLMFFYLWIRFELKTALSSLIIAPYAAVSILSLLILFRVPFTYNFMLPVAFGCLISYILYYCIFANIKSKLINKNNQTNDELVYDSIKNNKNTFLVFVVAITGVLVLLMLIFNLTYISLIISMLFAVVCSIYSGVVLPTTMWCEIYKKENDKRLKARIELIAKREEEAKKPAKKDAKSKDKAENDNEEKTENTIE